MLINRNCLNCNNSFQARQADINNGYGKYCSRTCSSAARKGHKIKQPNLICPVCNTEFYRNAYSIKNSKTGFLFCSRTCKEKAQSLNSKFTIAAILPSHYGKGSGIWTYRKLCFEHYEAKCNKCGYNKFPEILEVHHKDRDRTNNTIENLIPLCPTCHQEEHFLNLDGKWKTGGD